MATALIRRPGTCRSPARRSPLSGRRHASGDVLGAPRRPHNGDRRLVEEADGGLTLTYAQAAKRVRRWAGGIAATVEPRRPRRRRHAERLRDAAAVPGRQPRPAPSRCR